MRNALRMLAVAAALLLAPAPSRSGEFLDAPVTDLRQAVSDRVGDIEADADAAKDDLREAKKLAKSASSLATYTGANSVPDLVALGKGVKLIVKSGTSDESVLSSLESVLTGLFQLAQGQEALVEGAMGMLTSPASQMKIERLLAKYGVSRELAEDLLDQDPAKAAKMVVKALIGYMKAQSKAQRFFLKESRDFPPARECPGNLHGTMTATVGGDAFVARDFLVASWTIGDKGGAYAFYILAQDLGADELIKIDWFQSRVNDNSFPAVGVHELTWPPGDKNGWHIAVEGPRWGTSQFESIRGTLTITEFDHEAQTVVGTFEFEGQIYNRNEFIMVTDGQFSVSCFERR